MKLFYRVHVCAILLIAAALFVILSPRQILGFLAGAFLSTINLALIHFVWVRILNKKSVAWPVVIIVLKYTLLGVVLYEVATRNLFSVLWFGLGVGSIVISALVCSIWVGKSRGGTF